MVFTQEGSKQFEKVTSENVGKQLAMMRKYPWRELPGLLAKMRRILKRIKMIHMDYEKPAESGLVSLI